ncbi:uncharacterized protein OCT59_015874 [Rhizophagus irregularis]|uniref:uncharacterized protein n=1 Tax=Rhizophagus irregularis TaxID=588596 RepID=UPI003324A51A|nr:hypothetical protein OCT59_015874 [Rhizophagus irregularis]
MPFKDSEDNKDHLKYSIKNFTNRTSGKKQIDDFIQEMQLKIEDRHDIVLEWIPYNQFVKIKKINKNGFITGYSAIWKDGPLYKNWWNDKYTRNSNKKVTLNCLYSSQYMIEFLIDETKKYLTNHTNKYKDQHKIYGISQDPDKNDYILVQNNFINLINWASGNEKIDDFIQEMQLKISEISDYNDIVFEWIPYKQFDKIKQTGKNGVYSAIWRNGPLYKKTKLDSDYTRDSNKEVALKCLHSLQNPVDSLINEAKKYSPSKFLVLKTGKNGSITVYSAIWRNGPLYKKNELDSDYTRDSNKEIALKCLHNLQNPVDSLINEAKKYSPSKFLVLYGISQNPDTNDYILVLTWTSGNEKIDGFIKERQLNVTFYNDIVFEWIPYSQFNKIRKTGKNGFITVYSAIWKNGPLYYDDKYYKYKRDSNKEVALKCLHNLQNPIDSLINEAEKYSTKNDKFLVLYGISQNPDTNDYILIQNYFILSGNDKIDEFIQERQLKINKSNDAVFEWIPYNQFNEIRETGKNGSTTVYSAIWRNGPLYKKNKLDSDYTRDSNKEVALKCLHYLQNTVDFLINEAKKYSTNKFPVLYGISQNPDTNDYILVLTWTSGNEKIDGFIQERLNSYDLVYWIPYNQFYEIRKTGKNGSITVYSAMWNDPLYSKYTRNSNKEVALKCLHNFQNPVDSLINEAKKYSTKNGKFLVLYGISQNPDTSDYILVQNYLILSGNEKIDEFIQERQLDATSHDDVVFEWIPYSQFSEIKKTGKNISMTVYSALWRHGPLHYNYNYCKYTRDSNKVVFLKCLHNLQNPVDSLINEAKKYSTKNNKFLVLYGISQNPNTSDYILVQSYQNYLMLSGNEKIDEFIQERQLKINKSNDIVFEWIPYNQFNEIRETGKNGSTTVYSAIWRYGPLYYSKYTRDSNKKVVLKCLHNLQNPDSLIKETKKYSTKNDKFLVLYGISQNPDTSDYILVQNYLTLSGNEKIDEFIQERQLNVTSYDDVVFEWIPYNQFNEIRETGKNGSTTVYSAIWRYGPLYYSKYTRDSNKKVTLKCLHNLQNPVDFLINEAKKYSTSKFPVLYGISQNPDTNDYVLVLTWTSGNKKINDFIQEKQLNINSYDDVVFEWIPYNQFNEIKEIGKNGSITVCSAIWRNGPLYYGKYTRDSNKKVTLKYLHNLQDPVDSLINESKKYSTKNDKCLVLYGISQNPDTSDYILVQNNYIWTSGNKKIDDFIQERQLIINKHNDVVFEWIPYNQFNEIRKTGKNGSITVYSAIWRNGPLYKKNKLDSDYTRDSNKVVALKCLHNLQNSIDSLINEAEKSSTKNDKFIVLYGVSQNSDTNDYVLVQNNYIWTSRNEKIDEFIQERQLNVTSYDDVVFEWIPYNQFNEIRETGKNGSITVYSAIWKDGPLYYDDEYNKSYYKCKRDSNKEVALKCLHNLQNPIDSLINVAEKYSTKNNKFFVLYGISQNPDTNDYILIQNYLMLSGNEKIDEFIQERQLKINKSNDVVFEWIPYNQFNEIRKTGKNGSITVYSAIWRNGPLYYDDEYDKYYKYKRDSNKEVALKCLHNLQNPIDDSLINEAKNYSTKNDKFLVLYGISQNPDTNDYILVQNYLMLSGNEKIDEFIQERQLNVNSDDDVVFEWIPYNQFNEIKETCKNGSITIYFAIWKNGPLHYGNCTRDSNKEVALKCLHNLQDPVDYSLINEAKKYSTKNDKFFVLYGISQNPDTSDYILVLTRISGNETIDNFIQEKQEKISSFPDAIFEWIPYNQFNEIKEIGKGGFSTVYSAMWKDFKVALKCLDNSQHPINELLNEVKAYSTKMALSNSKIMNTYGISQDPNTKNYIVVLHHAEENRPDINELDHSLSLIVNNKLEIEKAEEYRKLHLSSLKGDRQITTHPQAIYTSRLLNPFTEDLPKYNDDNSECLDCAITNNLN